MAICRKCGGKTTATNSQRQKECKHCGVLPGKENLDRSGTVKLK